MTTLEKIRQWLDLKAVPHYVPEQYTRDLMYEAYKEIQRLSAKCDKK